MSGLQRFGLLGLAYVKSGGRVCYALAGRLYLADGRLVASVPRGLAAGIAKALTVLGAERPPDAQLGRIEILTPEEVQAIGADQISERGKTLRYSLGRLYEAEGEGGWEKVWYVRVHSPEMQALRRSYGLSSLPQADGFRFVVAVRRRGVLGRNEVRKEA